MSYQSMKISNKELKVPIIQGGMGVGISLSGLAGAVARCGGMGVISSVNCGYTSDKFDQSPLATNMEFLTYHIKKAKELAQGNGMVAVNIMTATSNYDVMCKCAVDAGADAIISGAGLPLKLPEYVKGSETGFAPIVSSGKAAALLCKSYHTKYNTHPDFIVIEGKLAGGHLGFKPDELDEPICNTNDEILKDVLEAIKPYEEIYGIKIPVFVAGGVYTGADIAHYEKLGASGVQMGTRFVATEECDASYEYKLAYVNAKKSDVHIIKSPVGMPARAIYTPLLERLSNGDKFKAIRCNNCIVSCQKGDLTPYCISRALIEAVKGNYEDGLFFCGENVWRVDKIISVKELIDSLMNERNMSL